MMYRSGLMSKTTEFCCMLASVVSLPPTRWAHYYRGAVCLHMFTYDNLPICPQKHSHRFAVLVSPYLQEICDSPPSLLYPSINGTTPSAAA